MLDRWVGLVVVCWIVFCLFNTSAVAEWLRAWGTLTMFEATVCGGREFDPRPELYNIILEWTKLGLDTSSGRLFLRDSLTLPSSRRT